jgi:hypothetical protein
MKPDVRGWDAKSIAEQPLGDDGRFDLTIHQPDWVLIFPPTWRISDR